MNLTVSTDSAGINPQDLFTKPQFPTPNSKYVMDAILSNLISILSGGGPQAILALLMLGIILLLVEKRALEREVAKRVGKTDEICDKYHATRISIAGGLDALRLTIIEIGKSF